MFDVKRKSHGIYNENVLSDTTKVKSIKDNHLHMYFGTSAVISMEAFSETDIPALPTTCPSTKTLPAKDRILKILRRKYIRFLVHVNGGYYDISNLLSIDSSVESYSY